MSVYESMYQEAQNHLDEIGKMEFGTEEYVRTVNCTNNMVDRLNEHEKLAIEQKKLKLEERKLEFEKEKLKSDKSGRLVPYIITGVTTAAGLAAHIWTVLSERKFEAGGHMLTSEAGRSSRRSLLSMVDKFVKK